MDIRKSFELATLAVEVATRPEAWDPFCDRVADALGQTAFMVFEYDLVQHRAPAFHGSDRCRTVLAPHVETLLAGGGEADHAAYVALADMEAGIPLCERELTQLQPGDPIPSNPWRDAVMAASGARIRFGMKLNDIGPHMDVAAFHLAEDSRTAADRIRAAGPSIYAMLARAIDTGRAIRGLTDSYRRMLTLFDRLDFAAAFVDGSGRVAQANAAFLQMARDKDGLVAPGGVLGATAPRDHAPLATALADAVTLTAPSVATLTLTRKSGSLPLVLRIMPVREDDVARGATMALVVALDPERNAQVDADGLSAFGVLTEQELATCDLLVRGHPAMEIAYRTGGTVDRVRADIASSTAKLSCRTRLDLLRLAMTTSAPVTFDTQPGPVAAEVN